MKTYKWAIPEPRHRKGISEFLLPSFVAILPFIFIGSSFIIVPKFELIFEDMLGGPPFPPITEFILLVPPVAWLFLATLQGHFIWKSYKALKLARLERRAKGST